MLLANIKMKRQRWQKSFQYGGGLEPSMLALKMGYFYWLRVKTSNHLQTELNLGYLKGTKFCLESKTSFIDISSIASFKPFLIAWLREYCAFFGQFRG